MSDPSGGWIKSFTHLAQLPRAGEALHMLHTVASLVKPLMKKHGWMLPVLAEFLPAQPNLLGINVNGGAKICLRLRPAQAPDTLYDLEDVIGTMLHELTHNVRGPHDKVFYDFLDKLTLEYDELRAGGYHGEGFFAQGTRMGQSVSHNVCLAEGRRRALEAAQKRHDLQIRLGRGGRLGGRHDVGMGGKILRDVMAAAAERRARDEKACSHDAAALAEAEKATREGIKTAPEQVVPNALGAGLSATTSSSAEDAVKADKGKGKAPPSLPPARPTGVIEIDSSGSEDDMPPQKRTSRAPSSAVPPATALIPAGRKPVAVAASRAPPRTRPTPPPSRLLSGQLGRASSIDPTPSSSSAFLPSGSSVPPPTRAESTENWACPTCTFAFNPPLTLVCTICDSVRPALTFPPSPPRAPPPPKRRAGRTGALLGGGAVGSGVRWSCGRCGQETEAVFWSCSHCGQIKASS